MTPVRLNRKFDAVIIHDVIEYMLTEKDLLDIFSTAVYHLNPCGVLLVELGHLQRGFKNDRTFHCTHSNDKLKYILNIKYDPDSSDTTIQCVMLCFIKTNGDLTIENGLSHYRAF